MAHTFDMGVYDVTFKAEQDLSSYQYYCVEAASAQGYVELATGSSGPAPIGILQNDTATSGQDAVVRMLGPTKAFVLAATSGGTACDVDAGDYLQCASTGILGWATTQGRANARALGFLDTGSAYINVFFQPFPTATSGLAN
jgi:hypothetical protein